MSQVNVRGTVITSGGGGGGGASTIADGADVTEGLIADAAVTGDNSGTISAKLRGWNKILADVWDSTNHLLKMSIAAGSAVIGHVITDTGSTTAVTGNVATTVADAANVTFGAKVDVKASTSDATPISAMSVWKQISFSIQAAVTALGSPFQAGGSIGNTAFTANAGTNLNTSLLALDASVTPIGAKTDAKNTATDTTSVSAIGVLKQISASVQAPPSQAVTNAGTFATQSAITAAAASMADGAQATIGLKADAKNSATDTTSVTAMSVWKQISASVQLMVFGAGTAAAAQRVVTATDDTIHGALTESAPATDVASSGLNGRLQRIAQRITSLISPALSVSVSVTRPSDTTTYGANDVVGVTGGGTAGIDFNLGAISASSVLITSVAFERDAASVISGETLYNLYLYNVTPPSALADNAAFDIPSGDRASFLGKISLGAPVDEGSTLYIEQNGVNKQIKLSGTHVFGYLVTVGGYQPTSAAVHKITLNAVQL